MNILNTKIGDIQQLKRQQILNNFNSIFDLDYSNIIFPQLINQRIKIIVISINYSKYGAESISATNPQRHSSDVNSLAHQLRPQFGILQRAGRHRFQRGQGCSRTGGLAGHETRTDQAERVN